MRIVIHDYAGHPFQLELSRWLAGRGHDVLHLYSADIQTPRGQLAVQPGDPAGFTVQAVSCGKPLDKYRLIPRLRQEQAYGRILGRMIQDFRPDAILSANTPPPIQRTLLKTARRQQARLYCWVQDIFTIAARHAWAKWPQPVRRLALALLARIEFGTMRQSDGLVVIAPDFVQILAKHGVTHPRTQVIENWAPRGEIIPRPRDNPWSARHRLDGKFVYLCAGTLGLKHDPAMLVHLAQAIADDPDSVVVVVSQGLGRDWLEGEKSRLGLHNLILLDFQPFNDLSDCLGSGNVLVVLLESFAGALSVPSKVYSYFCAGRPILGAIPSDNLARLLIDRVKAGLCVSPGDVQGFVHAAQTLRRDPALAQSCAEHQAAHVRTAFDMERIGPRFLDVIGATWNDGDRP